MKTVFCGIFVLLVSLQVEGIKVPSEIPEVTFDDLKLIIAGEKSSDLLRVGINKKISCFGVQFENDDEIQKSLNDLRTQAPRCFDKTQGLSEIKMLDGATRQTYATERGAYPDCLSKPMHRLSDVFDQIETEVVKLIQGGTQALQYQVGDKDFHLRNAPHKDQVRVYHPRNGQTRVPKSFMVPFHRDNGLFLILTPVPDHPLIIELESGNAISTGQLGPSTILVLMGLGTSDWLFQGEKRPDFWATPHAVPSFDPGVKTRTVFARMKVVPNEAVPILKTRELGPELLTFDEVFKRTSASGVESYSSSDTERTFDNWTRTMEQSCDEGSAFCWMGCLSIPNNCDQKKDNLTCMTAAQDPCFGDSMNPSCHWECVKAKQVLQEPPNENSFCRGATDMLM
ncbi:uncharacterized protein LOC131880360 [Tigriopus californicus]|uniref:uncharacterized protein LOC131880360 n=1 Tax=Tigriopus californicus TaxID=6832 RepID=UPI0027DA98F1|nr:uncharacterized protein LOC131880360 [Tigriopus californicus]